MRRLFAIAPSVVLGCALALPASAVEPASVESVEESEELENLRQQNAAMLRRIEALERQETSAAGDQISVGPIVIGEGHTAEEAISIWDDVVIDGHVLGDAVSVGGSVSVTSTGRVDGDAVSIGGSVNIAPGGVVHGDHVALSWSGQPLAVREATSTDPHHAAGALTLASKASGFLDLLYRRMVLLLTVAGAGVVTVGLFPQRVARVAAEVEERPFGSAIVGALAATFLTLFSALFVVLTLGIGSPVSLLVMAGLSAAWLLGFVGFCQAVGDRLPFDHKPHGRWLAFLVGAALIAFAGSLPWMGWVVVVTSSVIGIGSAFATRLGAR